VGATLADNTFLLQIFSYLGPLVLIVLLVAKDRPETRFHMKQGLVLFGIELVLYFASGFLMMLTFGLITPIVMLVNFACLMLTIIGIYHVVQKQEKPLPFVGAWADLLPV
jgi:uncharacterized membrane protein